MALIRKVNVYEAFIEGAKEGFNIAIKIIPFLVAILVAIGIFRASGAMDFIINGNSIFFCMDRSGYKIYQSSACSLYEALEWKWCQRSDDRCNENLWCGFICRATFMHNAGDNRYHILHNCSLFRFHRHQKYR